MTNRDKPATPVQMEDWHGLTKLEYAAIKAMDSVQIFIMLQTDWQAYSEKQFAEMCVKRANALFDELGGTR